MNCRKQLFSRGPLLRRTLEEIRERLDEKIEELVASGMSRKEGCRRFSPRIWEQLNPLWANLPQADRPQRTQQAS